MSVERIDYLVFGVNLSNYNIDFNDDKFLPQIEGHQDINYLLLNDYMHGNFNIFGKVLEQIDNSGLKVEDVKVENEDAEKIKIINKCKELFDIELKKDEITYLLFTNWY